MLQDREHDEHGHRAAPEDIEELIDLEEWAKAGKTPKKAKVYRIRIDKDLVPERDFPARIQEAYERGKTRSIVVEADSRLRYGDVKSALVAISKAGFPRVGLIVHKQES